MSPTSTENLQEVRECIADVAAACESLADYLGAIGRALDNDQPDAICPDQVAQCANYVQQLADICFKAVTICDAIMAEQTKN